MKNRTRIIIFVFWWICAILAGAVVYSEAMAQAKFTPNRVRHCQDKLAELANPQVMSKTTARREALAVCKDLQRNRPYFFRALVR